MAIYRFRVTFEDNEEIFREIDIKSTQHFEDFHNVIIQSIGFDNLHAASFYISDDYWRKGDEISLRPIDEDVAEQRKRKNLPPIKQMNKCKIASVIDDPHQKFLYLYDPKAGWTFMVELMKIVSEEAAVSYPKVTRSGGEPLKQYKNANHATPDVDDEEFDEEDEHEADDEAYTHAHDEDETALLEGEESDPEEEQTEEQEEEDFGTAEFDESEHSEGGDDF